MALPEHSPTPSTGQEVPKHQSHPDTLSWVPTLVPQLPSSPGVLGRLLTFALVPKFLPEPKQTWPQALNF